MPDTSSEAFAEFVEHREVILLIHNAKLEGFDFVVSSAGPAWYLCEFGTRFNNVWQPIGEGAGKTLAEAATKAWKAVLAARDKPIISGGEWSQATSIAGELASTSLSYVPIHGCGLAFTLPDAKLAEFEATALECSDSSEIWAPRYQLLIQIDGQNVIESIDSVSSVPPNVTWRHHMRGGSALSAGAHTIKLGFRVRPGAGAHMTSILANPKAPALISVRY